MRFEFIAISALAIVVASPAFADQVTVQYTATVLTVSDTPFGIDPALGTTVSGSFTYDTGTPDSNEGTDRGDYVHSAGGAFSATFEGHGTTVTGSSTPWVQIENLSSDIFRFIDGPSLVGPKGGTMSVNGVEDETIQLRIGIVDGLGATLNDDGLPAEFPFVFPGPAHTFSLSDGQGTLQLQVSDAVTPVGFRSWGRLKLL